MTVAELRAKFPMTYKFYYYKDGEYQPNAMRTDKVADWIVTDYCEVTVILK